MTAVESPTGPVRSAFAGDPDFAELLEMFVCSINEKRTELTLAFGNQDFETIRVLAHQLKGAGGGYGFEGLSKVAGVVEHAIADGPTDEFSGQFDEMMDYLGRITV